MAYEIPGQMITLPASTDLTNYQYHFVAITADGRVDHASAGGAAIGVLQNKPLENQAASIMVNGVSKIKAAAGNLSEGMLTRSSSEGMAVASTGNGILGTIIFGSSGGAGRVLSVLLDADG